MVDAAQIPGFYFVASFMFLYDLHHPQDDGLMAWTTFLPLAVEFCEIQRKEVGVIKRKKLEIPEKVSGRLVTNRGVHLQPFGFHGTWLDNASYWVDMMVSMGISWVVMLTEGDSVLEERQGITPLGVLLDAGIIPIIRDKQRFPSSFMNVETVRRTVAVYGRYGLRPFWQLYNEPFDDREWEHKGVPAYDKAWQIIVSRWAEGASQVVEAGAYVGFPDGPCFADNPFERLRPTGALGFFDAGVAFYAPHSYGKGRPLWYPYDAVTRHGAELSEEAYKRMLDDYQEDRAWFDAPVELLNKQRGEWVDPTRTAIQDDTCWRGWEKIVYWSLESLGYVPPMAMTEGGWTPRDRAGAAPTDIRWPHTTPKMVAKKTLHMYDTPSPFFAICPWLLADEDMGGVGWPFDAWHGWAYSEKYGRQKPVISTLQEVPPKEIEPRAEPMVLDVDSDIRDWTWLKDAYGASYRRGMTTLRLIEVHEYEGPATLDIAVVDSDGLAVEGVAFYYYHAGAPDLEGDEWYGQGVLKTTGDDGRLSFPAAGEPCTAGACEGALWPKGKGDVLEGLGLLSGTRNRHLNAVWQLVEEGTPAPPEPQPKPEESEPEPEDVEPAPEKPEPEPKPPVVPGEIGGLEMDPRIVPLLTLDLSGDTYKLEEILWMDPVESKGLHHIFLDVVDSEGRRLAGEKARVSWSDGAVDVLIEEKPGEPWGGNFGMFATMGSYAVQVVAASGTSDAVAGLGMGTPEEPKVKHHTSFGLRFVKGAVTDAVPPSEETEPEEEPEGEVEQPAEPEKPEEPDQPAKPGGPRVDPRVQSLLTLDLSGDTYKLEEILWMDPVESKGLHHIFLDVVDREGQRLAGENVRVSWSSGAVDVPIEEKPGEPWGGNFGMFATMGSYAVQVVAASGASDAVAGLGMGTPEEPKVRHHTSFGIRFRKFSA
jgi:hypothetical protein